MTLRDAGREFARLTGGLSIPKEHVELVQCVLNNTLNRINQVATDVWLSIPDATRASIPEATKSRLVELLKFFESTAEAAKTGETPAVSLDRQKSSMPANTPKDMDVVTLKTAEKSLAGSANEASTENCGATHGDV